MNFIKQKLEALPNFRRLKKAIKFNVGLKNKTTFKIGGKADIFFQPQNKAELLSGLNFFASANIPISVLGGGANLLVSDYGVDGAVVHLGRINAIRKISANEIEVDAGVPMEKLSRFCAAKGLQGFENFAGLPGLVGGAVFMNARCYDDEIASRLKSVKILLFKKGSFSEAEYIFKAEDWAYKKSPFQNFHPGILLEENAMLILSVRFEVGKDNVQNLKRIRKLRIADRRAKGHFRKPSCGSTFKNNRNFGKSSGAIIDELHLKGTKYGKAQVAPFHGNFIINNGGATANEVKNLIAHIQEEVKNKTGFLLEPEVIFAGRTEECKSFIEKTK
jgi:UDP-N-acetylmuramate dehydrogenase